jgi:cytochrome c1
MKLKRLSISAAAIICFVELGGCETASWRPPPPVTAEWAQPAAQRHVDVGRLRKGRTLFVSRCIECHTLPVVSRYKESDWPCIVHEMGGRANLKPPESDAVLAYILVAHSQSR